MYSNFLIFLEYWNVAKLWKRKSISDSSTIFKLIKSEMNLKCAALHVQIPLLYHYEQTKNSHIQFILFFLSAKSKTPRSV